MSLRDREAQAEPFLWMRITKKAFLSWTQEERDAYVVRPGIEDNTYFIRKS